MEVQVEAREVVRRVELREAVQVALAAQMVEVLAVVRAAREVREVVVGLLGERAMVLAVAVARQVEVLEVQQGLPLAALERMQARVPAKVRMKAGVEVGQVVRIHRVAE